MDYKDARMYKRYPMCNLDGLSASCEPALLCNFRIKIRFELHKVASNRVKIHSGPLAQPCACGAVRSNKCHKHHVAVVLTGECGLTVLPSMVLHNCFYEVLQLIKLAVVVK